MAEQLSEKARALLDRPVIATLATIGPDGASQVTPLWVDREGDDLLINTAQGRAKQRNIERDPRVAVSVIDPEDAYNVVVVKGLVTDVTKEGADQHIDKLAKKYLGVDEYPARQPGEIRLKMRIRPEKVVMQS